MTERFRRTPLDRAVFGVNTFELLDPSAAAIRKAAALKGHCTVKINPLRSTKALHENGFYYCDTLLKPFCPASRFKPRMDPWATVSETVPLGALRRIAAGSFAFGRFHRDFNIERHHAERRYAAWVTRLHRSGNILGIFYRDRLAGFVGMDGPVIALQAFAPDIRGRGMGKVLLSAACAELFKRGHRELSSSVSAANVRALNLYAGLGFRFKDPVDVYHRMSR